MRILEVNKFNFPNRGADRHFIDLETLLKNRGHKVAVLAMDHPRNRPSIWKKYFPGYVGYNRNDSTLWQKIKGTVRMFYSFSARRNMKRIIRDFDPQIIHVHNIYHQLSPSILSAAKKRKIPVIMTVHDYKLIYPNYILDDENKIGESFWSFVKNKRFKNSCLKSLLVALEFHFHKFLNIYDKNIDLYIVPSRKAKELLIKGGMTERKIFVLPHFIMPSFVPKKYIQDSEEKYVLYFGQISKEKGVDNLERIFETSAELNNLKLYLAGPVADGFKMRKSSNIKYLGILEEKELEKYVAGAQFIVSASRLLETFGLIALEAIGQGKPFVGFKTGALGEIIENDVCGYLVKSKKEFKDKIIKLSEDEGLRVLFSRNALMRSREFLSDGYYEKFMKLSKEAINKKGETKSLDFLAILG